MLKDNYKRTDNNLYYYKTNKFASIKIEYAFEYINSKKNSVIVSLLSEYILSTNKKYRTKKSIHNKFRELYNLRVSIGNYVIGSKALISFDLFMVDPRKIKVDYFKEALKLYKCLMLKPYFLNNKLDKNLFSQIKNNYINKQENNFKKPDVLQKKYFYQKCFINSPCNIDEFENIDELKECVESIKDSDIITFYNNLFDHYVYSIAFGNLLDEEIKLIDNELCFKKYNFDYKYDYIEKIVNKNVKIINEDTTQSYVYFIYKIADYDRKKDYLYEIICKMLNNLGGPIYDILREKYGIVYYAFCSCFYYSGVFYIRADIDKSNYDKAVLGINEIFTLMRDKKKIKERLEISKDYFNDNYDYKCDEVSFNIGELRQFASKRNISEEERLELMNKVTVSDVINQIDNLELKCVYFFKGDKK